MFNLISNQENATLNHNQIPFCLPPKMLKCQVLMEMFSSGNTCAHHWESRMESALTSSNNVMLNIHYAPGIPLLRTHPQENPAMCTGDVYKNVHRSIAKDSKPPSWNLPKCPPKREWIKCALFL